MDPNSKGATCRGNVADNVDGLSTLFCIGGKRAVQTFETPGTERVDYFAFFEHRVL